MEIHSTQGLFLTGLGILSGLLGAGHSLMVTLDHKTKQRKPARRSFQQDTEF